MAYFVKNTTIKNPPFSTGFDTLDEAIDQAIYLANTYGGKSTVSSNETTMTYTFRKGTTK